MIHDTLFSHSSQLALWTIATTTIKAVFDAAIHAMEAPDANSSKRYRYWFRFLNFYLINIKRSKLWNNGNGVHDDKADSASAGGN